MLQGLSPDEYERRKEQVSSEIIQRLESVFPGLGNAVTFKEVQSYVASAFLL